MKNIILLKLMQTKGIGEKALKKVIHFMYNNEGCSWYDLIEHKEILCSKLNIKQHIVDNIDCDLSEAEHVSNQLRKNKIRILLETDEQYPEHLKRCLKNDCPPVLFVQGNVSLLNTMAVGFCGSRSASERGLKIAEQCAKQLVEQDVTVVSGYARGADLSTHKAALQNNGNTIFILAEGILKYRIKTEVRDLLTQDNNLFVSQFYPLSSWSVGNAMTRNSTIIGISNAMVLVESGRNGGTFAAGEESLHKKCPLFVIDFAQPEVSAEANPYFLSKGGYPIRGKNGIPNTKPIIKIINDKNMRDIETKFAQINIEDVINNY